MANIKFTNFASSLLAVGVNSSATTLAVTGGQGAQVPVACRREYFYVTLEDASLNREIVKVTARSTDTFTIVRAQDNTTARAWIAGDSVTLRFNAAAINDVLADAATKVAKTSDTGSAVMPTGTTAQRDGTPATGYVRYNTDIARLEGYDGSSWAPVAMGIAAMGRNKIMNGDFRVAQRGTTFTAVLNDAYTLDRWSHIYVTSAVMTLQQASDTPSNTSQWSLRATVTTADTTIATGDYFTIRQHIEGQNVRDLIGQTFTLSFWVKSPKTGTHCAYFRNSGADRSYVATYTVSVANTWEFKTITVSGGLITAGTWNWDSGIGVTVGWTLAAGATFQTTANAWQTGNFYATSAQVNCLDAVNNLFAIADVQLEAGSAATALERRPYGLELLLCQRYYQSGTGLLNAYYTGQAFGGGTAPVQLKATMRSAPSLVLTAGTGSGSITTFQTGTFADRFQVWWNGNATATDYREFTYTATSEL